MSAQPSPDYGTSEFKVHVDVGGYKLHVQFAGKPRSHGDPLIILIHGTAGHLEQYAAVVRALKPKYRLLGYTRAGLGHSDPPRPSAADGSAAVPTLESITAELTSLLKATAQKGPYVLIGHSWGGMISAHIASSIPGCEGIVALDSGMPTHTNPPNQYDSFTNDPGTPWAHPSVQAMLRGLDTFNLQDPRNKIQFTDDEYSDLLKARSTPQHHEGVPPEFQGLLGSYLPYASTNYKEKLSRIAICLVHAHAHESFRLMYEEGLKKGNGTAEERGDMERLLATWKGDVIKNQRQFLEYAHRPEDGNAILSAKGTAHGVHMQDVPSVVKGLEWVMGWLSERHA